MIIQAKLYAMADTEMLKLIPSSEFIRIKAEDPKPLFRAYVIGHEGTFKPQAEGIGTIITKWFASAIRKLVSMLQFGTPIFHGHDDTNSVMGRVSIGEVVGKSLEIIKNKLSAVAVIYIKPPFRDIKLDVASIEADVDLLTNKDTGSYDADIRDITGVALADSSVEKPAFKGATMIAEMQAFLKNDRSTQIRGGGDMGLTLKEIREYIRTEGLGPSDLFTDSALTGDTVVKAHVKDAIFGELKHRKEGEGKVETEKEALKKELEAKYDAEKKELEEANANLQKEVIEGKVPALVTKIKEERKLDKSQAAFIDRAVKTWTPEKPEDVEKELNDFADKQIKEHQELGVAVYGQPEPKDKDKDGDGNGDEETDSGIEDMSLL